MDLTIDLTAKHLPCGASLDLLIEQVADGRAGVGTGGRAGGDAAERARHQAGCACCRAALAEAELRWSPVRATATAPVAVPEGLLRSILERVRDIADAGHGLIRYTGHGATRITARALRRIISRASTGIPGVAAVLGSRVDPGTRPVRVAVEVIATDDRPLPQLTSDIRAAIRVELDRGASLDDPTVDVLVQDIAFPGRAGRR
ncbi:MAG: hypothetical protein HKP61_08275 [Dactylosporangium sp.]|nr:hypothetical protein [Dactylosporangium sp.]NNJ60933.1 hypothetical protein [Dactylosporangium sp.]